MVYRHGFSFPEPGRANIDIPSEAGKPFHVDQVDITDLKGYAMRVKPSSLFLHPHQDHWISQVTQKATRLFSTTLIGHPPIV